MAAGPTQPMQTTPRTPPRASQLAQNFEQTDRELFQMLRKGRGPKAGKPYAMKGHRFKVRDQMQTMSNAPKAERREMRSIDFIKSNMKKVDVMRRSKERSDIRFQGEEMYKQILQSKEQVSAGRLKKLALFTSLMDIDTNQTIATNALSGSEVTHSSRKLPLNRDLVYDASFGSFKNLQHNFARNYILGQQVKLLHHEQQLHMLNSQRSEPFDAGVRAPEYPGAVHDLGHVITLHTQKRNDTTSNEFSS